MEQQDMTLYHYTDFIAFDSIIKNRELRVNNVLNMNDAAEMELFMKGIFEAVLKRLKEAGHRRRTEALARLFEEEKGKYFKYSAYAACFSMYRDDASQWERYADRGKGVCIGMRRNLLEQMAGGAISLQKVYYQDDMDSHPLAEEIYGLVTAGEPVSEDNPRLDEMIRKAWRNAASFKHPSFSSEHEVRLVVMPYGASDFHIKPCYHVAKERIKKYYPLDLETMCSSAGISLTDLIPEIIIGPESTQSLPILQDYLSDLGLNALAERICYSVCPLRSRI